MMANDHDPADRRPFKPGRRTVIIGGAVAAAGAAFWLNRGAGSDGGHATGGTPRRGGELSVAFDGAAQPRFALDPHHSGFAPHNRVIRSIYDSLTLLRPDGTIGPWLASSWAVSPDRLSYDFTLRKGVKFHDGTVFDAAALKANLDRLRDTPTLYSRPNIGPYAHSEILAPDRLRVVLSEPFGPLLRNLSSTKLAIVSPAAVAKHGATFAQNPVGTGPFRFTGLTQGTEIRLERNPDYQWAPSTAGHEGPAYIDRLIFKNVPEESTRVAVLQSGQAQVADLIPPQNITAFKSDPDFQVFQKELLNTNYSLLLNVAKAPWDDPEIRRAIRLSLDIDTIVQVIYLGTFARAWSPLSPSMFASAEKTLAGSWRPDPAEAARILDAKGWRRGAGGIREKDGRKLVISFLDTQGNREKRLDVIRLVRRQLSDNGIDLRIDSEPQGVYITKVTGDDFDMIGGASFHSDPDILRNSYVPEVRLPLIGNKVVDPQIIAWLKQGAGERDGPVRADLYTKVQRRIIEQSYAIPIYVLLYNLVATRAAQGIAIDAHGFPDFHGVWLNG